jgi:hypothetical protein
MPENGRLKQTTGDREGLEPPGVKRQRDLDDCRKLADIASTSTKWTVSRLAPGEARHATT